MDKQDGQTAASRPPDAAGPSRSNAPAAAGEDGETSAAAPGTEQYMRWQKQKQFAGQRRENDRASKPSNIAVGGASGGMNPPRRTEPVPVEVRRNSSPLSGSISPGHPIRATSPRRISPATSQIFERDVQDNATMPELSPAIPSHIQTEDHIPAVLEASSLAITDDHLNPDDVEIVTHTAHQPAAVAVANSALGESPPTATHFAMGELAVPHENEDAGSTYGTVDPSDPRRLSFISFADVVHAEQTETGKDSMHMSSPNAHAFRDNRSPSPMRSPLGHDRVPLSPPVVGSPLFRGMEGSPVRGGAASVASGQAQQHGELSIETMRQALQKTGSNDLTAAGVLPLSASSDHDGAAPKSFR